MKINDHVTEQPFKSLTRNVRVRQKSIRKNQKNFKLLVGNHSHCLFNANIAASAEKAIIYQPCARFLWEHGGHHIMRIT